jgi:DNA-binding response OmpR family regulator
VTDDTLTNVRVLVVEDDADILRMVATVLETTGANVTLAPSGHSALSSLEDQTFDAVVIDWNLGDMPGGALIDQLSATHPNMRTRTLVMTGELIRPQHKHPAEQAGYTMLPKPFRPAALRDAIARLIGP